MSANKSPGNARRNDGSKQGNEQNSENPATAQPDGASRQQGRGSARQAEGGNKKPGRPRNGSDSGGGKS